MRTWLCFPKLMARSASPLDSEAHRSSSSVGKVCYVFVDRSRQTGHRRSDSQVSSECIHTWPIHRHGPIAKSMNTVIRFEKSVLRFESTYINNIKGKLEQEKVVDCSSVWISPLLSTTSSGLMFRGPSTFAGVNMAVQDILLRWLSQVRYLFRHKHMRGYVHPKWGLRQGCTGSPYLMGSSNSSPLCHH